MHQRSLRIAKFISTCPSYYEGSIQLIGNDCMSAKKTLLKNVLQSTAVPRYNSECGSTILD